MFLVISPILDKAKSPGYRFSRINFANMEGNGVVDINNGLAVVFTGEVGDSEGDNSNVPKDAKGVPDADLMVTLLSVDPPSFKGHEPLFLLESNVSPSPVITVEALKGGENV